MKFFAAALLFVVLGAAPAAAVEAPLMVAVAANFAGPFAEMAAAFSRESGIQVEKAVSSTGKLYAQIVNGAPFDLFLAADGKRPEILHREGRCGEPVIYAIGRVVLWSGRSDLADAADWREALGRPGLRRVAIPNPDIAPYGEAAREALRDAGQWEPFTGRLVSAQNVAQAFQYAELGVVDAAFTGQAAALSERGGRGVSWEVEGAPVVIQKACAVPSGNGPAARRFLAFLRSERAAAILHTHGYR